MQTTLKFAVLALCLSVALGAVPLSEMTRSEFSLMDLMMRTSATTQSDPTRSMACFDYYVPLLSEITAEYERSYSNCLTEADAARAGVDQSSLPQREALELAATSSCAAFTECSTQETAVPFFQCYSDAGSDNTKIMYTISANASETLAVIMEEYRLVDNDEYRCTNASERVYVENTSTTYEALQSCLLGLSAVPSTSAPTTTTAAQTITPVDTTTTIAPETPSTVTPQATTSTITTQSTFAASDTTAITPERTTTTTPVIYTTTPATSTDVTTDRVSGSGSDSVESVESVETVETVESLEVEEDERNSKDDNVANNTIERIQKALEQLRTKWGR